MFGVVIALIQVQASSALIKPGGLSKTLKKCGFSFFGDLPVRYFGEIPLRESRDPKNVAVVCSSGGWISVKQVSASPRRNSLAQSPNAFGVEIWKYLLDPKGAGTAQVFTLCEADGDCRVDDNYGPNDHLQIIKL